MKAILVAGIVLLAALAPGCGGEDVWCDDASACAPSTEQMLSPIAAELTAFAQAVRDGTPVALITVERPNAVPTVTVTPLASSTPNPSPPGETGIAGTVLIGPQCPVVREDEPCPDQPYEADIDVYDASGALVSQVRSDANGEFFVALAAGAYRLEPRSPAALPYASPVDVIVVDGRTTSVVVSYDSGIR